jgi:hypothetical protein
MGYKIFQMLNASYKKALLVVKIKMGLIDVNAWCKLTK